MSEKEESYYKILDTTAKISQRRVKEKYIQAVKQHPPETDPERFEKIREAYDTLKDPMKRKQYDLARKYGGKVEKMLQKAATLFGKEQYQATIKVFNDVLQVDDENLSAQIGIMTAAVLNEELEMGEEYFKRALANRRAPEEIEPEFLYSGYANVLIRGGHPQEANDVLEEGIRLFPTSMSMFCKVLTMVCMMLGNEKRALEVAAQAIPNENEETFDDFDAYMSWIYVMANTERWSEFSKVQSRFRKFLKKLDDEEKEEACIVLMEEYEEAFDICRYRLAEIFIEFAQLLTKNNEIKEQLKETKKLARVEKEMNRLYRDESIFPMILYHTLHWFYEDEFHPAIIHFNESIPLHMIEDLKEEKELYAAGILQLKKKYPAIYSYFKLEWDELFLELTKSFNREMKRELRRLK